MLCVFDSRLKVYNELIMMFVVSVRFSFSLNDVLWCEGKV